MIPPRKAFAAAFVLSLIFVGSNATWAGERLLYDDVWWEEQYGKLYDTPHCQEIIPDMNKIRAAERQLKTLKAPLIWALSFYFAKKECADSAPEQALTILTDLAERGEGVVSVYLAQFHHIKHGANAPSTQSWMERAKYAMPLVIHKNWRKNFYQPSVEIFQKMGAPLSPQLERIFLWGEETLNGPPEPLFQIGMTLLEHASNLENKVLGCSWIYEAGKKGHPQARLHFAQLHIWGDGIVQDLRIGMSWLDISVNKDKNVEALIFLSQLLEQGDVYQLDLTESYIALLIAESLGADVKSELTRLRTKLSDDELESALWRTTLPNYKLSFQISAPLQRPHKSQLAPRICQFLP